MAKTGPKPYRDTPGETQARNEAKRLNRKLHLAYVKAEAAALRRHERAMRLLDKKAEGVQLTEAEREFIRDHRFTNRDLYDRRKDLTDRYGDPVRRTVDIDLENAPPTVLVLPDSLWEDKPDAAGSDRGR